MSFSPGTGDRVFTIGRDKTCDIPIADDSVSRVHATLTMQDGGKLLLGDRKSANGTFVMRTGKLERIDQAYISPADQVQFGSVVFPVKTLLEALGEKSGRTQAATQTATQTDIRTAPVTPLWPMIVARLEGHWRGAALTTLIVLAVILLATGDPSSQSFKFFIGILGSLIASLSFTLLQRFWERK